MKVIENIAWIFYVSENASFDHNKVGKWMYFFRNDSDMDYISKLCSNAVEQGIVAEAKHTNPSLFDLDGDEGYENGVCCFYINCDDIEGHKRILSYFLENNMIQRTKTGRIYNISFKLDNQTRAGEYGSDFKGTLKLADFIDLNTGQWIYTDK